MIFHSKINEPLKIDVCALRKRSKFTGFLNYSFFHLKSLLEHVDKEPEADIRKSLKDFNKDRFIVEITILKCKVE